MLDCNDDHHHDFEKDFWGNCTNTFSEDQKHYCYAKHMGLEQTWFGFDVRGKRILDIGGGPTSMLLKCYNLKEGKVCDPIDYPSWTKDRYKSKNISVAVQRGEDVQEEHEGWDEVWIYNVLQHTDDPELIITNAKRAAPVLRIFEWIDIPAHEGHPHMLTQASLEKWIGRGTGETKVFDGQLGCLGNAFYGCFTSNTSNTGS
jgi:hypothetical protein